MTEYDYIVVGGGTAGCVVAARLTQDASARVLLLEAGSSERTPAMTVPAAWPQLLGTAADWAGVTIDQAEAGPVAYPRGRILGGSGAINAMAHVRGHRAVYDGWAKGGAAGWGFGDLLPYFRRSEQTEGRDPALRGTKGAVRVGPAAESARHPVARAFAEALGHVRTRAGLRDFVRRTVDSYHHPVGTCRMGPDTGAVVDLELRVRGITGLRVADASVMPAIPNAHPAATVLAIAERAADLIGGR